ncbi:putative DNA binding domain-containing protein [Corallococcus sp. bb12-1]|uniref:RNA-binding domain-containing protein n=1 Tax=Corallococcus sp. bb12-1 TaxID=2996784 RepID=UPI002271A83D|nr:ATP-binding protein [Corallococcus sp. bb12-1]MCY1043479.1 putative DNA binding domain-containing protein [Corallococcus sp. bb12-1]
MAPKSDEMLEQLLRLGEDSFTEFKSVVHRSFQLDAEDIAKAIASMANTKGGLVLIGVEDDGTVTGTGDRKHTDKLMTQVGQLCQDRIEPPLICTTQKREYQGQTILQVEVPAFSPSRPHRAASRYYVRDGNVSREAKREELVRMLQSTDAHFDEQEMSGASIEDLDTEAVRAFFANAYQRQVSDQNLVPHLTSLKCLERTGVPTVAGILMFGTQPTRWLLDARISAVRVQGRTISSTFLDRQDMEGRLLDQIDQASAFIQRNIAAPSHVQGMTRVEDGLPVEVIREAVLNAVTHRDYRPASQIRISIFDDRIEFTNPGDLLNHLTLENIRQGGISQKRNPILASLLAKAQRRENLGFGVPDMVRVLGEKGFREPTLEITAGHFKLVLWTERVSA